MTMLGVRIIVVLSVLIISGIVLALWIYGLRKIKNRKRKSQ